MSFARLCLCFCAADEEGGSSSSLVSSRQAQSASEALPAQPAIPTSTLPVRNVTTPSGQPFERIAEQAHTAAQGTCNAGSAPTGEHCSSGHLRITNPLELDQNVRGDYTKTTIIQPTALVLRQSSASRSQVSAALENLPTAGRAAPADYPAAASLPVSLDELDDDSERPTKSKHRYSTRGKVHEIGAPDVTVRALSQLIGAQARVRLSTSLSSGPSSEGDRVPQPDVSCHLPSGPPAQVVGPGPASSTAPRLFRAHIQGAAAAAGALGPAGGAFRARPHDAVAGRGAPPLWERAQRGQRRTDGGLLPTEALLRAAAASQAGADAAAVTVTVTSAAASGGAPAAGPTAPSPAALTVRDSSAGTGTGTVGRAGRAVGRNLSLREVIARQNAVAAAVAASSVACGPQPASAAVPDSSSATATAAVSVTVVAAPVPDTAAATTAVDTASGAVVTVMPPVVVAAGAGSGRGAAAAVAASGGHSIFSTNAAVAGSAVLAAYDGKAPGVFPALLPYAARPAHGSVAAPAVGAGAGAGGVPVRLSEPGLATETIDQVGGFERRGGGGGGGKPGSEVFEEQLQVPEYGSVPLLPVPMYGSQVKLNYQATRHLSQAAFFHMLQAAGSGTLLGDSGMPLIPPQYQPTVAPLNPAALSRELTALRWIGQGGGGAVFQAIWQGAPVAVKLLLSEANPDAPGELGSVAMEGVVSSVVNHPNVVHTFAFQCTRLTESSFCFDHEYGRQDSSFDDQGNPDLFDSLLDTSAMYGSFAAPASGTNGGVQRLAGGGGGGGAGPSRFGAEATHQQLLSQEAGLAAAAVDDDVRPQTRYGRDTAAAAAGRGVRVAAVHVGTLQPSPRSEEDEDRQVRASANQRPRQGKARGGGGGGGVGGGAAGVAGWGGVGGLEYHRQAALESTFQSEEGFGDPDLAGSAQGWTVLQALTHLRARPGMFMTYIIMEYCDRGSLLAAIRRGVFRTEDEPARPAADLASAVAVAGATGAAAAPAGRFPRRIVLRALLRTARDVAQGMSHLHANGIIHGDLKPGNVLLRGCRTDRRGFVAMVGDFGLSKVTGGEKPLEAHHWSTVTVMAPEVIMGRWLKASDVFSFGILLWQLVTNEPLPYGKLTVPQILMGVSQGTLKPEWPASAHPAVVRLGRACLATSPEKRPSFEAIVKVLTKIEKHVRNELRPQQRAASGAHQAAAALQMMPPRSLP